MHDTSQSLLKIIMHINQSIKYNESMLNYSSKYEPNSSHLSITETQITLKLTIS